MSTNWTDEPLVADYHKCRKVHVDELRSALNDNIEVRGGTKRTWGETIIADSTRVKANHVNEIREGIDYLTTLLTPCATNTVPIPPTWTEPDPMVADDDAVKVRAQHIQELRLIVNEAEDACYCDCHGHCSCVSHSHCACAGMAHCCCQGHSVS